MRRLAVLWLLLPLPITMMAQGTVADPIPTEQHKLLVVPFEDKMFFTDVMKEMVQGSGLNPDAVVNTLRNGVQLSIRASMTDSLEIGTFLSSDSLPPEGLVKLYEQMSYRYLPMHPTAKRSGPKKSGIEHGQVKTVRDTTTRYMSSTLKDAAVLESFHATYGFDRFLLLSQMDVRMDLSNPELSIINGNRTLAVHYTVLDAKGNPLSGGVASFDFEGGAGDLKWVMSIALGPVATQLVKAMAPEKKKEQASE
ncbi:MAG: hypothetical protein K9J06_10585 [Flavobacteriales bacterium]|nr:hypothetical protein [Flavobacteriales bacterium]